MSNLLLKLKNIPYIKEILIGILFVISSYTTYFSVYNFIPVVTSDGRGILNVLPIFLLCFVPLFTLIITLIYNGVYNVSSKYKTLKVYGYTLVTTQAIALIIHIMMIVNVYKGKVKGVISPLFPYDTLAFIILFLVIGLLVVAYTIKNRALGLVEKTSTIVVKKRRFVAMGFTVSFACYFAGVFMSAFNFIGSTVDPNWLGMIPVIVSLLLMMEGLGLYYWYSLNKNDEKRKVVIHRRALFIYAASIFVIYLLIVIALSVNHFLLNQSLSPLFVAGYAIKIPAGVVINFIGAFTLFLVAVIKYWKRYISK